ncbi:hypothetical protein QAD02_009693 [Eretmocerus hayati]|uniref:Uncharacterized protein n=1 Tax=Eretmocerus hayati TaxID=131215 RepID=A0ACC2NA59_9HYME|nr:hypothetical protein QAD02_009693 [Eretmocerus hayati]
MYIHQKRAADFNTLLIKNVISTPLEHQLNDLAEDLARFRELDSAVRWGQIEIVEKRLQQGTPVNLGRMFCELRTPLLSSVYLGDLTLVQKLLQHGASVNARYCGDTPLTLAVKFERYEIADLLLQSSGLENCSSSEGITHFHIACMRGQVDVAKKLLQCKQDVEKAVDINSDYWAGYTSLHFAVKFQHIVVVEFLLSLGTSIIAKDGHQHTPLHLAHLLRNEKIIDIILRAHEEVFENPIDSKGLSHFHIACTRNNPNIVEHFLTLNVELEDSLSDGAFYWKRKKALDLAIHYECIDVIKSLLHHGAHKRSLSQDKFDFIRNAHCTGSREIIDLLSVNENLRSTFKSTINGYSGTIGNLLLGIPTISNPSTSSSRCSLLVSGIKRGMIENAKSLLIKDSPFFESFLDFTKQDHQGKSTLHLAFEQNLRELTNLMLNFHKNFNINPVDNNGLSHLHIACARNHVGTIQHLLNHGADVNSPVNSIAPFWSGFTPLHFAAEFGSVEATQTLLEQGADYAIKNASNFTAFDIAMKRADQFHGDRDAFRIMKAILTVHYQRKNPSFNDRGVSLLHLACTRPNHCGSTVDEMIELLKAHPNDINKCIDKTTCDDGNIELMKYFLERGVDPDYPSIHVGTGCIDKAPLHLVIHEDPCMSVEAIELLLKYGADPNARDYRNNTPLHFMFDSDYPEIIEILVNHGADINAQNFLCETPLISLCKRLKISHENLNEDEDERLLEFLDNGADINLADERNLTPLSIVCKKGIHLLLAENIPKDIETLLAHRRKLEILGADVSRAISAEDEISQTFYSRRIKSDKDCKFKSQCTSEIEIMKQTHTDNYTTLYDILFKNSTQLAVLSHNDSFQQIVESQDLYHKFPNYGFMLKLRSTQGKLRWPLLNDSRESLNSLLGAVLPRDCVEEILQYLDNQDLKNITNSIDNNGLSHLHIACAKNHVETIQHLLNHGADVNSPVNSIAPFWSGFTPLHFAAKFGSVDATLTLLEKGANYTIENASNFTAFDIAMTQTDQVHTEMLAFGVMKVILTFNSRCKSASFNDRGVSPLHLAWVALYSYGSTVHEMIELLKDHPNDINKASHKMGTLWDGFSPFHFAIDWENNGHAILLKKAGADIFMQDADGDTAFHLRTEVTEELEFQFDPQDDRYFEFDHRGSCGDSIFLKACDDGNIELMKYFLERGVDPDYPSIHVGTGCIDKAPLHLVIFEDPSTTVKAVELLLKYGADPNSFTQLAVLSQNDLFRQIVYAEDFHTKYPNYGFMLKSRLTQGKLRWPLLKKSRKILNSTLGIVLPRDCVENIIQYLDNQDLKNIM